MKSFVTKVEKYIISILLINYLIVCLNMCTQD